MPTYQYACTACDHAFEQVQSFSEDSLTVCPECQGRLRKVYNAVGVVFKGSGFYKTDSRSSGDGSRTSGSSSTPAAASDGASGASGSSTGSDSSGSKGSGDKASTKAAPSTTSGSAGSTSSKAAAAGS